MKSHIDSRTVGIQQPRDGEFLLFNKSGSKVHISGLLHSLLQWKKEKLLQCLCARGTGVEREGGGSACSQASGLLAFLLVCFFFLAYQPQKSKKITTAPTKENRRSFRCATSGLQAALPSECGHDWYYLRRRWELPSRASGAPILTRPIYKRGKWPIYLWDLCQLLTCGRLANAKMGYSMDWKEVKSCNFTFKICISRQKYVQEGMRLSAVWWTILRTIKGKKQTTHAHSHFIKRDIMLCHAISGCAQMTSQNRDPYRESDKHGPFKRCVSILYSSKCFQRPRSPGSLIFTSN